MGTERCCSSCVMDTENPQYLKFFRDEPDNPDAAVVRYHVHYFHRPDCWGYSRGISTSEYNIAPGPMLAASKANGLSKVKFMTIWKEWFSELERIHERYRDGPGRGPREIGNLFLIVLSAGLYLHISRRWIKKREQAFNDKIKWWQETFTTELRYEGYPFHVKTQSISRLDKGVGNVKREYDRWIAFALTDERGVELQKEPHLYGIIEKDKWGGIDETALVWHPAYS